MEWDGIRMKIGWDGMGNGDGMGMGMARDGDEEKDRDVVGMGTRTGMGTWMGSGRGKLCLVPAVCRMLGGGQGQAPHPAQPCISPTLSSLQDPTNGYYNVRAHEDRPASRTVLYADYRAPGPGRYDARPPSRLSHSSGYAQLNTYSRGPASEYSAEAAAGTGAPPGTAGGETASQLSYENYGGHAAFPASSGYGGYRLGYGQPTSLERAPYDAYDPMGKYASATRFSYTSQHSDYGQRFQQRMQTHV